MWKLPTETLDEKCEQGWPAIVAAAEAIVEARERNDVLAELAALRDLFQLAHDETTEAASKAVEEGLPWATIGRTLGIPTQTAHQRFRDYQGFVWEQTVDARGWHELRRPRRWWKLNVDAAHLASCQRAQKFGTQRMLDWRRGDVLLLQQNRATCPDPHARITGALIYESFSTDSDGESLALWGTGYEYILVASDFVPTEPFSIEDLAGLEGIYSRQGQMNHQRILEADVPTIAHAAGLDEWAPRSDPSDA